MVPKATYQVINMAATSVQHENTIYRALSWNRYVIETVSIDAWVFQLSTYSCQTLEFSRR